MTLANADCRDADHEPASVTSQLRRFESACAGWTGHRCLANSAGLLLHPQIGGDAVRPGIALYGATSRGWNDGGIVRSAAGDATARARAVGAHAGRLAVGYGSRWQAQRASRIGVLACGYADGYPRTAPEGTPVWIGGQRVPLAGRVSMDMISIDLTDAPKVDVGAQAELWGERIPVDEVAEACGTIGYELLCALARRVPVREIG